MVVEAGVKVSTGEGTSIEVINPRWADIEDFITKERHALRKGLYGYLPKENESGEFRYRVKANLYL